MSARHRLSYGQPMAGIVRAARRPPGWSAPGPKPLGPASEARVADDEDLCFLSGDWRLFQKQRGHRWSLDDLVTAWLASAQASAQAPAHCLDLGCGIGSVLLMIAWRFPAARCLGIEAQPTSAALARKSIAWNGVEGRVELLEGDFRHALPNQMFELVTGTPPYFPLGSGTLSEKVQAGPCRFEHRGGVEAYCDAAARVLSPLGSFVFCESAGQQARVQAALEQTRLQLRRQVDVIPREGKAPLISVFCAQRSPCEAPAPEALVVRDCHGQWTPEFVAVRRAMGMPSAPGLE
jgi:tRNA1Val (adenine37-N6)-methyltransferase